MNRRDALVSIIAGGTGIVAAGSPVRVLAAVPSPAGRRRSVRFAHFTDTHVYAKRNASEGLAAAIRHVEALPDRPDFVLNGGDAI